MTRYPIKEARDIIVIAKRIGWRHAGYTSKGHPVLVHENGETYILAATPSSHRNRANSLNMLEKLSGCKLHPKKQKQAG